MNITFPKAVVSEQDLYDKLLRSKSLSEYYLTRIGIFEEKGYPSTDEKIAQLIYLIEDSCKHVTTFCQLSRKVYLFNVKNDQTDMLIELIETIKIFIDDHWKATRYSLDWIGINLFPDDCFPFRFTETEEILTETEMLVKNKIIENLVEILPTLFDNFEKIFSSLKDDQIDLNLKENVFFQLKLANTQLKKGKSLSTNELFSILNMIDDAFSIFFLNTKAVLNNPLKGSFASTLASLKFPSIFNYTYKIYLEKFLKKYFKKFNSITIYGNGSRDDLSPLFFQSLLTTFSEIKDIKKYHITLTNLGLTDDDLKSLVQVTKCLNIDTFNLTGNLLTGKNLKALMSLVRCNTWILINNPIKP